MIKKALLFGLCLLAFNPAFGQSKKPIVAKNKIVNSSNGDIMARFNLSEGKDTLIVELYDDFNVNPSVPEMTEKLKADPELLKYIQETLQDGTVNHRALTIVVPEQKGKKDLPKKIQPLKSPKRFSIDYSLGRHTDQFSGKFRYAGSFGIEGTVATSLYRGDVSDNYLYLGLSQDFDQLYYTKWQGHFSLGPIVNVQAGTSEILPGLVVVGSLYRQIDGNFYFGPKIMLGSFNELSFSISTRF